MLQLNPQTEKLVDIQDSVRLVSCLPYSLSSMALLGKGECFFVRPELRPEVPCSIFATPSTVLRLSGSVGLSLYVTII